MRTCYVPLVRRLETKSTMREKCSDPSTRKRVVNVQEGILAAPSQERYWRHALLLIGEKMYCQWILQQSSIPAPSIWLLLRTNTLAESQGAAGVEVLLPCGTSAWKLHNKRVRAGVDIGHGDRLCKPAPACIIHITRYRYPVLSRDGHVRYSRVHFECGWWRGKQLSAAKA